MQSDGDDVVRGELKQDGYSLDVVPRPDRKGGGIALLYRENLKKFLEIPLKFSHLLNVLNGKSVARTLFSLLLVSIGHHTQRDILLHKQCL